LCNLQEIVTENIKYVDRHSFGNLRMLVRIPGTLHPKTKKYCTYVDLDNIRTANDILEWCLEHHVVNFGIKKLPDVRELIDIDYVPTRSDLEYEPKQWGSHKIPSNVFYFLKNLIRPCVVNILMIDKEPPHEVRTDLVTELMWLGYSENDVFEIIRKLNWVDFNEKITRYHIHKIFEKKLYPPSCKKLANYVYCTNCGWFYWWGVYNPLEWGSKKESHGGRGRNPAVTPMNSTQCEVARGDNETTPRVRAKEKFSLPDIKKLGGEIRCFGLLF
jgi:hypothetical protein